MGSSEEPNKLLSVKRAGQGEAHVWEQEETPPQVPGTARNPHFQILPGLGAGLSSSLHKSLRGKMKIGRHFFSLIMRKNDTQEAFQTFLQYGLSFWWERNEYRKLRVCHQKKTYPWVKSIIKKNIIKGDLVAQSWLSGQYASKTLKITSHIIFQNEYWTELKNVETKFKVSLKTRI